MYLEKCTDNQRREIYREFNITEDSLKKDVHYLMEWLEKQPHLPNVKDETLISHLLIQCKNSIERTKRKLDTYYTVKALLPNFFTNRDPTSEGYRTTFDAGCLVPLPKLTPEGYRIFIYRIFDLEKTNLVNVDEYLKMNYINHDINMKDDCNRKIILIYDVENMTMGLANTIFIASRKYLWASQDLYAFRVHMVHIILRLNPTFSALINIVKSLLKKKIVNRLAIWNNERPDFTTMFPVEILPEEYGGKEKPLEQLHKMYYEYICEFREWLKSEEDVKTDLSKRSGDNLYKRSTDDSLDGSFRQLMID